MYDGIMKLSNTSKSLSYRTYSITSLKNNIKMGEVTFPNNTTDCWFGGIPFWSPKKGFRGETQVPAKDGSVYFLTPRSSNG